jgi:hypothetical protein
MTHPSQPEPDFPTTLDEAVERLLLSLTPAEKARLAAMPEKNVEGLNQGLGAQVRKICGLWRGNPALMRSCDALNPEDTSLAIIRALWTRLR